jgi:FkbM family methyltransferase
VHLHKDPNQSTWDMRILAEIPTHYTYADVFDWADMRTVIDVGAHIGGFTTWLKSINPEIDIAAIEADRENFNLAALNFANKPGIHLYRGAIHFSDQPVTLRQYRENANAGSHTIEPLQAGGRPYDGPLMSLTSIIAMQRWQSVDAIKFDCEGSEYSILAQEDLDLLKNVKVIVGEYHDGPERLKQECIRRLAPFFDVVHLHTTAPLGQFCLVNKDYVPCG